MFYPDDLERLGALSTLVGGRMLPWVRHHWRQLRRFVAQLTCACW
jgi:hypothetical protein